MADTKYGKHILAEPLEAGRFDLEKVKATPELMQADCRIIYTTNTQPVFMEQKPMVHDFTQFLCFIGGDPLNVRDFGAEIEFYLGEEEEKHIINHTSVIHIPPGLVHCPLNFKRIDKPIIFIDIVLTSKYEKKFLDK